VTFVFRAGRDGHPTYRESSKANHRTAPSPGVGR
jgi:hypothetical protein